MKLQDTNKKGRVAVNSNNSSNERFDFDVWAREVKRQMIAAIKKRASK